MRFFAPFLLDVFLKLGMFFTRFITRRFAIALSVGTVFLSMVVGTWTVLTNLLNGIEFIISDHSLLLGIYSVLPSNFEMVMSLYFSARLVVWAYNLNADLLKMYMGGI